MLKKTMILLLALLVLLPAAAVGEDAEPRQLTNVEGFVYTLNADGTAEIAGYTGESQKLVIPGTVDGHPVTSISRELAEQILAVGHFPKAFAEIRQFRESAFWK